MRYVQSIRTAWPAVAVVLAAIGLAGCTEAAGTAEASISFPAEKLTLSIPPMTLGKAASPLTLPEAEGADDLTYSLTSVPAGLMFDGATRVLSGTPTAAGTYAVTYTATNATGSQMASLDFTITVRPEFQGTWSHTNEWHGDDEVPGYYVDTLTFTRNRYILARAHYFLDGTLDHVWNPSGGWSEADASTLTRVWEGDHDDRDDTPPVMMSVAKPYLWADEARNLLLMHHWMDDEEQQLTRGGLELYRRVADPLPSGLTGVWQATDEWDAGPVVIEMTIGADGTFTWVQRETNNGTERITAMWTLDQETYFLDLRGASATWTPQDGTPEPVEDFKADRIAFAPTDSPDRIIVSPHWHETEAEGNDEYRRYGDYWLEFHRQ